MSGDVVRFLTVIAAVGAATTGGVFSAFSTFVMKALGRLPEPQGMAAMQAINRAAPAPGFMSALFGTATLCVGLAVFAVGELREEASNFLLIGAGSYLLGIVVTVAYHVPRNQALAAYEPGDPPAAQMWARYVRSWTAWNHLRTLACLTGAAAFVLADGAA